MKAKFFSNNGDCEVLKRFIIDSDLSALEEKCKNPQIMALLNQKIIDLETQTNFSLLELAFMEGEYEFVKRIIKLGVDIDEDFTVHLKGIITRDETPANEVVGTGGIFELALSKIFKSNHNQKEPIFKLFLGLINEPYSDFSYQKLEIFIRVLKTVCDLEDCHEMLSKLLNFAIPTGVIDTNIIIPIEQEDGTRITGVVKQFAAEMQALIKAQANTSLLPQRQLDPKKTKYFSLFPKKVLNMKFSDWYPLEKASLLEDLSFAKALLNSGASFKKVVDNGFFSRMLWPDKVDAIILSLKNGLVVEIPVGQLLLMGSSPWQKKLTIQLAMYSTKFKGDLFKSIELACLLKKSGNDATIPNVDTGQPLQVISPIFEINIITFSQFIHEMIISDKLTLIGICSDFGIKTSKEFFSFKKMLANINIRLEKHKDEEDYKQKLFEEMLPAELTKLKENDPYFKENDPYFKEEDGVPKRALSYEQIEKILAYLQDNKLPELPDSFAKLFELTREYLEETRYVKEYQPELIQLFEENKIDTVFLKAIYGDYPNIVKFISRIKVFYDFEETSKLVNKEFEDLLPETLPAEIIAMIGEEYYS